MKELEEIYNFLSIEDKSYNKERDEDKKEKGQKAQQAGCEIRNYLNANIKGKDEIYWIDQQWMNGGYTARIANQMWYKSGLRCCKDLTVYLSYTIKKSEQENMVTFFVSISTMHNDKANNVDEDKYSTFLKQSYDEKLFPKEMKLKEVDGHIVLETSFDEVVGQDYKVIVDNKLVPLFNQLFTPYKNIVLKLCDYHKFVYKRKAKDGSQISGNLDIYIDKASYQEYKNNQHVKGRFIIKKDSTVAMDESPSYEMSPGAKSYFSSREKMRLNKNKLIEDFPCESQSEAETIITLNNGSGRMFKRLIDGKNLQDVLKNELETLFESDSSNSNLKPAVNRIYYGIPGCGKSYRVENEDFKDEEYRKIRTVFHPDYTYSDFVGQIMPKYKDGHIEYPFVPGPFTRALEAALKDNNQNVVLIIEEINRGNAAAIFGDIFQLLDRNDKDENKGKSEYAIDQQDIYEYLQLKCNNIQFGENKIKIPKNLSIVATMNTTDQNLYVLDSAFTRRWEMIEVENNFNNVSDLYIPLNNTEIKWQKFVEVINKNIPEDEFGNEDKKLGGHFVTEDALASGPNVNDNDKQTKFVDKVLRYLWKDVLRPDNRDKIFNSNVKTFVDLKESLKKASTEEDVLSIFSEMVKNDLKKDNNLQTEENNE